jgi:hypothetical protein
MFINTMVKFPLLAALLLLIGLLSACQNPDPILVDPLPESTFTSAVTPTEHIASTIAPNPVDTAAPENTPLPENTPTPPAQSAQERCEVAGEKNFTSQQGNFCFAYPADFEFLGSGNPLQAMLLGPALDQSMEPVRAGLYMRAEEIAADSMTLEDAANRFLAQFAGMGVEINRSDVIFAGLPAIQLEPVPGREGSRDVLIIHNNLLYHFTFTPSVENFPQAQADFDRLFNLVDSSFSLLQP